MRIAVINGPNLNMLGIREPEIYGKGTLEDLERLLEDEAKSLGVEMQFFQSNHEGAIVDWIQSLYGNCNGILINPAAYTHTSVAIPDAIQAVGIPTVEVHLSDVDAREPFRAHSYVRPVALRTITGKGFAGYVEGLRFLAKEISK